MNKAELIRHAQALREKAAEMRHKAELAPTETKWKLIDLAFTYDQLANEAAQQAKTDAPD